MRWFRFDWSKPGPMPYYVYGQYQYLPGPGPENATHYRIDDGRMHRGQKWIPYPKPLSARGGAPEQPVRVRWFRTKLKKTKVRWRRRR